MVDGSPHEEEFKVQTYNYVVHKGGACWKMDWPMDWVYLNIFHSTIAPEQSIKKL